MERCWVWWAGSGASGLSCGVPVLTKLVQTAFLSLAESQLSIFVVSGAAKLCNKVSR